MTDSEFLNWVADRFVNVYKESSDTDFVRKLRHLANKFDAFQKLSDLEWWHNDAERLDKYLKEKNEIRNSYT